MSSLLAFLILGMWLQAKHQPLRKRNRFGWTLEIQTQPWNGLDDYALQTSVLQWFRYLLREGVQGYGWEFKN